MAADSLTTTSLQVTGQATVGGYVSAAGFSGNCITDSLAVNSSTRAASAAAVYALNQTVGGFLPLTGGTVSGALNVSGNLNAANINVLGTITTINTTDTVSTSLTINNLGTGPALKVTQSESGALGAQPVAQFYNGTGTAALIIDNNGNVGVNKSSAATEMDISGTVTATAFVGNGAGLTGLASAGAWVASGVTTYTPSGYSVGVGTAPYSAYMLDVNGAIHSTLTSSFVGGVGAGRIGGGFATVSLDVSGCSTFSSNVNIGHTVAEGKYALDVSGSARVGGLFGVGKDPSGYALDVSGGVNVSGSLMTGSFTTILPNCTTGGNTSAWDSSYALFSTGNTTTSSAVAIGYNSTTNFGVLVCLAPGAYWRDMKYMAGTHSFYTGGSSGVVLNGGATSWSAISDRRSKTNIQPLKYGLDEISHLKPVRFDYIKDGSNTALRMGFIAQEVLPFIPEAVTGSEETEYGLSITELIPAIVNAIKQLTDRLKALENH